MDLARLRLISRVAAFLLVGGCGAAPEKGDPSPDRDTHGTSDTASSDSGDSAVDSGEPGDTGDTGPADADGDGYPAATDCDDDAPDVYPGAPELPCDGVDADCDGHGGTDAFLLDGVAFENLQDAVEAATDGDVIEICPGTWETEATIAPALGIDLTLRAWSGDATDTVLDGAGRHPVLVAWAYSRVTVEDLTLANGLASTWPEMGDAGGAVYGYNATLLFRRAVVRDSAAERAGGGVALWTLDPTVSSVTFEDTTVSGNSAEEGGGGYVAGTSTSLDAMLSVAVHGGTFSGNRALNGGGLHVSADYLSVDADGATFSANEVTDTYGSLGAGLYVSGRFATVHLASSTFDANASAYAAGGAYVSAQQGDITLDTVTMDANTAGMEGAAGAMLYVASVPVSITDSTFTSNVSSGVLGYGGALVIMADDADVRVTTTTFTANEAHGGGGLFILGDAGTATFEDTTFDGNLGGTGGAIYGMGSFVVDVSGGGLLRNSATRSGGGLYTDGATANFSGVDLGAGAATNLPTDVYPCTDDWGAGATFTLDADGCH